MKFNYYTSLNEQAERILAMCNATTNKEIQELKQQSLKWRELICDKLYTDFLPPIERRDLLYIVQQMGYIAYETAQVLSTKACNSADGLLLKNGLQNCASVLCDETRGLEKRTCCATRLRRSVFTLLSIWRDCVIAGSDRFLCDGFEAVAEALLRYVDAIEAATIII